MFSNWELIFVSIWHYVVSRYWEVKRCWHKRQRLRRWLAVHCWQLNSLIETPHLRDSDALKLQTETKTETLMAQDRDQDQDSESLERDKQSPSMAYTRGLKLCPHWRPQSPISATVAEFGDCRRIRRQIVSGDYSRQCGQGLTECCEGVITIHTQ